MHEHEKRLEALLATKTEAPRAQQKLALPTQALLGGGPARSGDVALSLEGMLVGFPRSAAAPQGVPILRVARLEATRGDRIGVVGPNGAGKTTLLRTVAGVLSPLDGFVRLGANVQPGYLAQIREAPIPGATVMDAILAAARVENGPARSYLARFLFRGEDVFKPVAELSGGERSRLELALLGITPANLLLLDEPTNHLDIPAREALESFLRSAESTMLIVSHDRRLLESVCGSLWVVEPGVGTEPGTIAVFDGGYTAWRAAVNDGWTVAAALARAPIAQRRRRHVATAARRRSVSGRRARSPRGLPPAMANVRRRSSRRCPRTPTSARSRRIEDDLTRLGVRKNQLELALGDSKVQTNFVELRRLTSELADVDGGAGPGRGGVAGAVGARTPMTERHRRTVPHRPDRADRLRQVHGGADAGPNSAPRSSMRTRWRATPPAPARGRSARSGRGSATRCSRPTDRSTGPRWRRVVFADPAALATWRRSCIRGSASWWRRPWTRPTESGAPFAVIEAIKLVEGGLASRCDEVWLVECPDGPARTDGGRGMTADDIDRRLAAQSGLRERLAVSHAYLDTSGTLDETRERGRGGPARGAGRRGRHPALRVRRALMPRER